MCSFDGGCSLDVDAKSMLIRALNAFLLSRVQYNFERGTTCAADWCWTGSFEKRVDQVCNDIWSMAYIGFGWTAAVPFA